MVQLSPGEGEAPMRLFDVLGPIMIGPSSSHTAGAVRIGNIARDLLGGEPREALITLHGSFAATHKGHGTDLALVGGLLGFHPDDERIRDSFKWAEEKGLKFRINEGDLGDVHPNTVRIELTSMSGDVLTVTGSSIGGGKVEITEISGLPVSLTAERNTIVASYPDRPGVIAAITTILAKAAINIGTMKVSRSGRGKKAICIIEVDQDIPPEFLEEISKVPVVEKVIVLKAIENS